MNYYHLKSNDDRVFQRVPCVRYTRSFRTEISAMASSLGWSESKCVNYLHRKLEDKRHKSMEGQTIERFNNRLVAA